MRFNNSRKIYFFLPLLNRHVNSHYLSMEDIISITIAFGEAKYDSEFLRYVPHDDIYLRKYNCFRFIFCARTRQ